MVPENSFTRTNSLYFPLCFLQGEMVPTPTTEPATWPTQWHSTAEIKTNFMIVVQIIKSPAGFPSKMKAHLFSEVYNLVVNVSFGPKHPKLGFCLEHITTLWEKNGPHVVPLCLSIQGTMGLKMTFCCFISGNSSHWAGSGGPGLPLATIVPGFICETGRLTTDLGWHLFLYLSGMGRGDHIAFCDTWIFFPSFCVLILSFQKSS